MFLESFKVCPCAKKLYTIALMICALLLRAFKQHCNRDSIQCTCSRKPNSRHDSL